MKHFSLPKDGGLIEKGLPKDILHSREKVSLFKIFTCFQFFNTHLLKQFTTDFRVICGDIVYAQKDEGAHMLLLVYRPSVYAHLMVASLCVPSRVAIEFPEIGVDTIDSQSGEGTRDWPEKSRQSTSVSRS